MYSSFHKFKCFDIIVLTAHLFKQDEYLHVLMKVSYIKWLTHLKLIKIGLFPHIFLSFPFFSTFLLRTDPITSSIAVPKLNHWTITNSQFTTVTKQWSFHPSTLQAYTQSKHQVFPNQHINLLYFFHFPHWLGFDGEERVGRGFHWRFRRVVSRPFFSHESQVIGKFKI